MFHSSLPDYGYMVAVLDSCDSQWPRLDFLHHPRRKSYDAMLFYILS